MRYLLLFLLFAACTAPAPPRKVVTPAFYIWKTVFTPGQWEVETLQQWHCQRLYVKYGDIDWKKDKGAIPVSITTAHFDSLPENIGIVPVFFIVNRVFTQITDTAATTLAQRMVQKIREITPPERDIPEIQIDCDWTSGTRDRYFYFLNQFRSALDSLTGRPKPVLSATIRLHQVKYREKTGVPPVDRGLLMLYNFDNPTNTAIKNSILDIETARSYLGSSTPVYPIPLDAALPLFGWGLHFRGGDFQGFLRDFRSEDAGKATFLTRVEQNIFRVNTDTSCMDTYFRRGDWVRIEEATSGELLQVWNMAKPVIPNDTCHLLFFDLNTQNLRHYQHEDLVKLLQ